MTESGSGDAALDDLGRHFEPWREPVVDGAPRVSLPKFPIPRQLQGPLLPKLERRMRKILD